MFLKGTEDYLIPCLNKKIFGVECLGCGIQRATVFFFKGEFFEAFKIYPGIYPLFLLIGFIVFNLFVKFKYDTKIKFGLIVLSILIIVISYAIKMAKVL